MHVKLRLQIYGGDLLGSSAVCMTLQVSRQTGVLAIKEFILFLKELIDLSCFSKFIDLVTQP